MQLIVRHSDATGRVTVSYDHGFLVGSYDSYDELERVARHKFNQLIDRNIPLNVPEEWAPEVHWLIENAE